jgi:hypothetical protein
MSQPLQDPRPASLRRREAQRRLAEHRAVVRDVWTDFENASVVAQARAHRIVDWARTISALVGVVGAIVAVRRMTTRGSAMRASTRPALRTMAIVGLLRRLLPTAYQLYVRRP